jgi:hypothetical protein
MRNKCVAISIECRNQADIRRVLVVVCNDLVGAAQEYKCYAGHQKKHILPSRTTEVIEVFTEFSSILLPWVGELPEFWRRFNSVGLEQEDVCRGIVGSQCAGNNVELTKPPVL